MLLEQYAQSDGRMVKKGLLTKKVAFQGTQVTMYSIDGVTWSTRPEELEAIIQRHILQQAGVSADLKGEEKVAVPKVKPKKFNRVHDDSELDEVIEEDSENDSAESEESYDDEVEVDETPKTKKASPVKNEKSKAEKPVEKPVKVEKPKAEVKAKPAAAKTKSVVSTKKPAPKKPAVKPAKPVKAKPKKKK